MDTEQYKIEKGIWQPSIRSMESFNKFPLMQMEKGDSFLIPKSDYSSVTNMRQRLYSAISKVKYIKKDVGFRIRQVDGGIRVWRDL